MNIKNYMPLLESAIRYAGLKEVKEQQLFLTALEKKMQRELERLFKEQGNTFISYLRDDHIDRDSIDLAFEMTIQHTRRRFIDLLTNYKLVASYFGIRSQAKQLGLKVPTPQMREAAAQIGISFDAVDKEAYKYISEQSAQRVSKIDDTTRNEIRNILAKGTEDKLSYSAIAQNIRDKYKDFATPASQGHIRDRAELIAVTEIRSAHEHSQSLTRKALKDAGWQMEKSWGVSGDGLVCDICQDNADAGWIDDDDVFPSGDAYPGAHPGCRCYTMTRNTGKQEEEPEQEPDEIPNTAWDMIPDINQEIPTQHPDPEPFDQPKITIPVTLKIDQPSYTVRTSGERNRAINAMAAVMGLTAFTAWLLPQVQKQTTIQAPSHEPDYYRDEPVILKKRKKKIS